MHYTFGVIHVGTFCNGLLYASASYYMTDMTNEEKRERGEELSDAHADYNKALNAYAFFKVSDRALGQDLVQDTFMKTWSYLVKNGKIDGMKSFLYHILNNLIVDEYRKKKHKPASLDIIMEKGFSPSTGDVGRLANILDGKQAILYINRLPDTYQKVMKMRFVQELTLKEISLITGQSENTISVRVHRGVQKLKLLCEPTV